LLERDRFSLEIVGSGSAEAKFRELAESMGLDREVQFVGPMSREQVAERYRQVDLFTLPPLSEAFGNVFAEAMASGLPIVGTNSRNS
jgi:glycosyltransferase involved in cell wall biosynthesis